MYNIYILESQINKQYYIGSCKNIFARLKLHNASKVRPTKHNAPWKIVHVEKFNSRKEAIMREKEIKSWKSRKAIEKLIMNFAIEDPR